jgi:hypothetical protein
MASDKNVAREGGLSAFKPRCENVKTQLITYFRRSMWTQYQMRTQKFSMGRGGERIDPEAKIEFIL